MSITIDFIEYRNYRFVTPWLYGQEKTINMPFSQEYVSRAYSDEFQCGQDLYGLVAYCLFHKFGKQDKFCESPVSFC